MEKNKLKNVYFISNYATAYGGNFLLNLKEIEKNLEILGTKVTY